VGHKAKNLAARSAWPRGPLWSFSRLWPPRTMRT